MIPITNEGFTSEVTEDSATASVRQPQALCRKERRLERIPGWRAANREYLREYLRRWKAVHPERVRVHRQREFAKRRSRRRRLRLRREAQRRRRAAKRSLLKQMFPPPSSY